MDKKGESKIVSHGNTRLKEQEHASSSSGLSEPPSPTRSRINAAITGTPCESFFHTLCTVHSGDPHNNQTGLTRQLLMTFIHWYPLYPTLRQNS